MENKKYLDKVVESLVRSTKVDNDKDEIQFPFHSFISSSTQLPPLFRCLSPPICRSFSEYCKNVYGLTDGEVNYVWEEYKKIILDKVK